MAIGVAERDDIGTSGGYPFSAANFFRDKQGSRTLGCGLCCRFQMRLYMPLNEKLAELTDGGGGPLFAAFGAWIFTVVHTSEDFDRFEEPKNIFYLIEIIR